MSKSGRFEFEFGAGQGNQVLSGIWRVWSAKNHPDLYLATTVLSGTTKASIHLPRPPERPCCWRSYSFTSEAKGPVAEEAVQDGGRHKVTWPGAVLGGGFTLEWRVIFPGPAMALSERTPSGKTTLLAPPATDKALIVITGLGPRSSDAVAPRVDDYDAPLLAEGHLCDGTLVWMRYLYIPQSALSSQFPQKMASMNFRGDRAEAIALARRGALRAASVAEHSDGSLCFLDARVVYRAPG
jgi:hypothetical protein